MCIKKRNPKPKINFKRKLFLSWLVFELASIAFALPSMANIVKNNLPADLPRVAQVDLPPTPGQSRILMASNGPFVLISTGALGPMNVNLYVKGNINGSIHGSDAQAPGDLKTCSVATAGETTILYRGTHKTADRSGLVLDQAVMLEINYAPTQTPKFEIINLRDDKYAQAVSSRPCRD